MSGMLNDTLNALPVIIDVDGRPWWSFPGGELLPVVSGGDGPSGGGSGEGSGSGEGTDGGGEGSGDGSGEDGTGADADDTDDGDGEGDEQDDRQKAIKSAVDKALRKARSKWEREQSQAAERAKLDETEKAKAEKADAEAAAAKATADANRKLVVADAKVAAVKAKVPADRVDAFVKLADLSDVDVDDDGTVDEQALGKAVKATLKAHPFLVATEAGRGGSSGGDMNGNGGKAPAKSLEDAVAARYAG